MSAPILSADDPDALARAADVLADGGLVAVPTETVYGLAADATSAAAVARIYAAKGRPAENPLIAHVADRAMAERFGVFGPGAAALADAFWPGPLTLVVPVREPLADAVHAGLETVALRHAPGVMGRLAAALGRPLAAPSANRSGRLSPTNAERVAEDLGERIDLILDGGPCGVGLESTIFAPEAMQLLRPGAVDAIEAVLEGELRIAEGGQLLAPGMMVSHYAPEAALRLNAAEARDGEMLLGFGEIVGDETLSASGDLEEAARGLYAALARLDARSDRIAVAPIPAEGIGVAINDRLARAAAPRG